MARHPILPGPRSTVRHGRGGNQPARRAGGRAMGGGGGGGGAMPARAVVALGGWTFSAALIVMGALLAAPAAIVVGAGLTLMFTRSLLRWAPRAGIECMPLRAQPAPIGVAGAGPATGGHGGARPRASAYCGPDWVTPVPPVVPLSARRRRILAGLDAMAGRSTFPGEAAAFRAKADQLRRGSR